MEKNQNKYYNQKYEKDNKKEEASDAGYGGVVCGRNPVAELLKSGRSVDKLFVAKGRREGSITAIVAEALDRRIPVIETDRNKLDALSGGMPHQGVAAMTAEKDYKELDELIAEIESRQSGKKPLIVIADGIEDPHNMGALIRTAECSGADCLIIPKRRSVGLTPVVAKAAAGALEYLPIVKTPNLAQVADKLKARGYWIFVAEPGGSDYAKADYTVPAVIIFGGEGSGVSRLLKEKSDFIVSIPVYGKINSLNVSNAAAVILYEAAKQRNNVNI